MRLFSALFFSIWLWIKIFDSFARIFALIIMGLIWIASPILALCIWCLIALLVFGGTVFPQHASQQKINTKKTALRDTIAIWENLRVKYPNSRDILLNLATLYERNGEVKKSTTLFTAAKKIDPSSKK